MCGPEHFPVTELPIFVDVRLSSPIFIECEKSSETSAEIYKDAVADVGGAMGRELLRKKISCDRWKDLVQQFQSTSTLLGASNIGASAGSEGQLLHQVLFFKTYKAMVTCSSRLCVFRYFLNINRPLPAALKLLHLKMEFVEFYPMPNLCTCELLKKSQLQY